MLSTIINAIVGIQEISVRFMNGIEPVYTGEAREFFNETRGSYTNCTVCAIFTVPFADVVYIYIDEE